MSVSSLELLNAIPSTAIVPAEYEKEVDCLLEMPAVLSTDQKFVGIYAIYSTCNLIALSAAGNYTVDWGDGVVENFNTGVTAYHEYDYNTGTHATNSTERPVTLTAATSTISTGAVSVKNGEAIRFYNLSGTTGVSAGNRYFVVNSTGNSCQIATTVAGTPISITGDGTATLLLHRQVLVTVTPQAGQSLTSLNLSIKHNRTGIGNYATGWLAIALASSALSSLVISSSAITCKHRNLKKAVLRHTGTVSNFAYLFAYCTALKEVVIENIGSVTTTSYMFTECRVLPEVPLFNTASVTDMSNMFSYCVALVAAPFLDTAEVTNMSFMFYVCTSLKKVPLYNTAKVTNMSNMFSNCYALVAVPHFNTGFVTTMASMFTGCYSLERVPKFNTVNVTSMSEMFAVCASLVQVPAFVTGSLVSTANMFSSCTKLKKVPKFNTSSVTTMSSMFSGCFVLEEVPDFDTTNVTALDSIFSNCALLRSAPSFNNVNANASSAINNCYSLVKFSATNAGGTSPVSECNSLESLELNKINITFSVAGSPRLSKTALEALFRSLGTASPARTITVTGCYGVDTSVAKTLTVTSGSKVITTSNTTGLSVGMLVTGTPTSINSPTSFTVSIGTSTFSKTAHGFDNGKTLAFASVTGINELSINKVYYIVNVTADTFQVSETSGGAAVTLSGTATTCSIKHPNFITAISAGTSITFDTPLRGSGGSFSLTFRLLDVSQALLKNWSVTF